jgi:hypothetical protein
MSTNFEGGGGIGKRRPSSDAETGGATPSQADLPQSPPSGNKQVAINGQGMLFLADGTSHKVQVLAVQLCSYPDPGRVSLCHRLVKTETGLWRFRCRDCLREFVFASVATIPKVPIGYECANHLADGIDEDGTMTVCWKRPAGTRFVVPCERTLAGDRLDSFVGARARATQ